MKKFIYILNIFLLLLIPTTIFTGGKKYTINYEADTKTTTKMIKTTVLLDRSNKKKEEVEQALKEIELQEEKEREKEEQERKAKEIVVKQVTVAEKVVEEVSSLASSAGASDATNNSDHTESKKEDNIGNSTTVTINPSEKVYVGAKLTGSMSAYGRDCCSTDPSKQGFTASGYNIKLNGMYYQDAVYGRVRILAADTNFKLYSIIKVNDPLDGQYTAIVLDRGDKNIGIDRKFMFDLVVESQEWAKYNYGVHKNINFEILRIGR